MAVDRSSIVTEASQGRRRARVALSVLQRLSFHLSGAQLGITISSLVLGFVAEPAIAELIEPAIDPLFGSGRALAVSIVLALALATAFQMVVGELIPKNFAIARPKSSALALAGALRLHNTVFKPLISVLNGSANWLVRRFGIEPSEELITVRTRQELEALIRSSGREGTIAADDVDLLTRTIRFSEKTADDVMIPRVAITALPQDATAGDLVELSGDTGYSRFPVFGRDLDDIVGVVHVKSVYRLPPEAWSTRSVSELMSEARAVPEYLDLEPVLADLRASGGHMAVVVDEYGGTAGIITLEDVLEELVGEIADEHDPLGVERSVVAWDSSFIVPGNLHPDEVTEASGFAMPKGEFETLAGFVLERLGHIPEVGERFEYEGWTVEVLEATPRRIVTLRLERPAAHGGEP
ncbi:MAG: hypothetical protein JJLCMIEE_00052 [Acidimicrobiales bacterium]|nr:hypothetical protein [Acidimicrobiales bacterium]